MTRLKLMVTLSPETPEEVINTLRNDWEGDIEQLIVERRNDLPSHQLFDETRSLFLVGESDNDNSFLKLQSIDSGYQLKFDKAIKNYEGEIELFLDWIAPYVISEGKVGTTENTEDYKKDVQFVDGKVIISRTAINEDYIGWGSTFS